MSNPDQFKEIPGGKRFKICDVSGCGNPAAYNLSDKEYKCESHFNERQGIYVEADGEQSS